jgi:hypothetical protein
MHKGAISGFSPFLLIPSPARKKHRFSAEDFSKKLQIKRKNPIMYVIFYREQEAHIRG